MFQTMMIVAVPALVTLTAAFFLLRSIGREQENARRTPPYTGSRPFSSSPGSGQTSGLRKRKDRRNVTKDKAADVTTGECVVCFEDRAMVEIYPCRHTNMCEDCVNKIICKSKRVCPFCRGKIQGYGDLQ